MSPARAARLANMDLSSAFSMPIASNLRRSFSAPASPAFVRILACSLRSSGSSGVASNKFSRLIRNFSSSPDSRLRRLRLRSVATSRGAF